MNYIENIRYSVKRFIEANEMMKTDDFVVCGVSGGADSLSMLLILNWYSEETDIKLIIAHVNHMLRTESTAEAEFVENIAKKLGLEYRCLNVDIKAESIKRHLGIEECARDVRYEFFKDLAKEYSDARIAVAHTLNDRAETVIFNIFRGTGLEGLKGISAVNGSVIRPVLNLTRADTESYCKALGYEYCTDLSNFENDFTRNKIRNILFPKIYEIFGQAALLSLLRLSDIAESDNEFINIQEKLAENELFTISGENGVKISINLWALAKYHKSVISRLCRRAVRLVSGKDLDGVNTVIMMDFIKNGKSGKYIEVPGAVVSKEYDIIHVLGNTEKKGLLLQPENGKFFYHIISGDMDSATENFAGCYIYARFSENCEADDLNEVAFLFEDILEAEFRYRKSGDFIELAGMKGRKKLQDFYIDIKLPVSERDRQIIFTRGNNVLWIPGIRKSLYCLNSAYKGKCILFKSISI